MLTIPPGGVEYRILMDRVRDLIEGRSNASGSVTLAAGTTTTTVARSTINANASVTLTPTTAHAAAEIGNGTMYVNIYPGGGSFVITHANNAQTDRTFYYLVLGG